MEIHHGRHHKAYVDNLNKAIAGHEALEKMSLEHLIGDVSGPARSGPRPRPQQRRRPLEPHLLLESHGPQGRRRPHGQARRRNQRHLRQLRRLQGEVRSRRSRPLRQRLGLAPPQPGGKLEIASTANQDNPLMGKAVAGCEGKPSSAATSGNTPTT
jgi:Fe-Mn family superoxide dismutase